MHKTCSLFQKLSKYGSCWGTKIPQIFLNRNSWLASNVNWKKKKTRKEKKRWRRFGAGDREASLLEKYLWTKDKITLPWLCVKETHDKQASWGIAWQESEWIPRWWCSLLLYYRSSIYWEWSGALEALKSIPYHIKKLRGFLVPQAFLNDIEYVNIPVT